MILFLFLPAPANGLEELQIVLFSGFSNESLRRTSLNFSLQIIGCGFIGYIDFGLVSCSSRGLVVRMRFASVQKVESGGQNLVVLFEVAFWNFKLQICETDCVVVNRKLKFSCNARRA